MIIIKNKISYNYFVPDNWAWTNLIKEAGFFDNVESAKAWLLKFIPTIDIHTCEFFELEFNDNRLRLKKVQVP